MNESVEIGEFVDTCGYRTKTHVVGDGHPLLLLHGSGAGVSAWANWRGLIPEMAPSYKVIAPDLVGFGFTETPANYEFRFMQSWVDQIIALLDGLGVESTHVLGNSFGGSLALWLAVHHPDRLKRIVLMGPGGWPLRVNDNLKLLWGYEPTLEHIRKAMSVMAYNQDLITDELVEMRLKATQRPGALDHFLRLFPEPKQQWLDKQTLSIGELQGVDHEVLLVHGRDDRVVDPMVSWNLHQHLKNSQLHMFSKCGHWTMIEKAEPFRRLVKSFYAEG